MQLHSLTKVLWPPNVEGDRLLTARVRCLNIFCVLGGSIGSFSGFVSLFGGAEGYVVVATISALAPLVLLAAPFLLEAGMPFSRVASAYLVYTILLMLWADVDAGGLYSHAPFFMVAWGALVTLCLGWRTGVAAAAFILATYGALYIFVLAPSDAAMASAGFTRATLAQWLIVGLGFNVVLITAAAAVFQAEMQRANQDLRAAVIDAAAASEAKSAFLATMSHEIRTPMNGILGMADLLARADLPEKEARQAATLRRSGWALLSLLDDVLDYSKIEAGQLTVEEVALSPRDLLRDVGALFAPLAENKGLTFTTVADDNVPSTLVGDPVKIRQIMHNLVSNAIKFTERGGVRIGMSFSTQTGLGITVSDTGIGIPAAKQDAILERFVQADSTTTRRFGGTGLGLSITKGLTDAMGGDISIQSTEGEGATFVVNLPLKTAADQATLDNPETDELQNRGGFTTFFREEPDRAGADSAGFKVLVADDNSVNRTVIREMLRHADVALTEVDDGDQAIAAAAGEMFDLILMDISMPQTDGCTAAIAIRAAEKGQSRPPVPIIGVTAHRSREDRTRCMNAGMDAVITKPITTRALEEIVSQFGLTERHPEDQSASSAPDLPSGAP